MAAGLASAGARLMLVGRDGQSASASAEALTARLPAHGVVVLRLAPG